MGSSHISPRSWGESWSSCGGRWVPASSPHQPLPCPEPALRRGCTTALAAAVPWGRESAGRKLVGRAAHLSCPHVVLGVCPHGQGLSPRPLCGGLLVLWGGSETAGASLAPQGLLGHLGGVGGGWFGCSRGVSPPPVAVPELQLGSGAGRGPPETETAHCVWTPYGALCQPWPHRSTAPGRVELGFFH